jgi:hypothetical protein
MRIMAAPTDPVGKGPVHKFIFPFPDCFFMTAPAEGGLVSPQQIISGGIVGRVAEQALPLNCRGMRALVFARMTIPA